MDPVAGNQKSVATRSSGKFIHHGDDAYQNLAAHSETTAFDLLAVKGSADSLALCGYLDSRTIRDFTRLATVNILHGREKTVGYQTAFYFLSDLL
jgi:hypothetical protein